MKTAKKIAYVSGTRADFGIMSSILKAIDEHPKLELQTYVTGIHITSGFGSTYKEVVEAFPQTKIIRATFDADDFSSVAGFMGKFLSKLVKTFSRNRPDFVLVLGDRPEEFCVALACLYLNIPTGHFRGGEVSSTFDEVARHAITKLCSIHFAATTDAAARIKKMGEEPWRVHVVGEASLDVILNQKLPTKKEVYRVLKLPVNEPFILLTQHSVSYELKDAGRHIRETLAAVKAFNVPVVAIYPHADAGGRQIIRELEREKKNPVFRIFPSLEYKLFLACQREAAVWVGNSSGALVESSSFATPVVNIGTRQEGRQRGGNVIDAGYNHHLIAAAIKKSWLPAYRARLRRMKNSWGDGMTGKRVARIIGKLDFNSRLVQKRLIY